MGQTTGQVSASNCKIEYSLNNIAWVDMSGMANSIKPDGGERDSGEEYTFDGDVAAVTFGKRKPLKLKVKALYTEGASDVEEIIRASYENNSDLYIRYSPKGQSTGTFLYTSSAGRVLTPPYPEAEAKSADPIAVEFTFTCAKITKSTNA